MPLLQVVETAHEEAPHSLAVFLETFFFDDFEHLSPSCHGHGVAAIGGEGGLVHAVGDFFLADHSSEREAVPDLLGHGHDVGCHVVHLEAPIVGTRSAESSLDLVTCIQAAGVSHVLDGMAQVPFGERVDAADSHDGFGDEHGNIARGGELDGVLDIFSIASSSSFFLCPFSAKIVREVHKLDTVRFRQIVVPGLNVGEVGYAAHAVVTVAKSEDRVVAGVDAG
mmetsp:Transcript_39344/g.60140  ORF Transcript_39344/g.60140 Transcript_39344/m.60140 type:complete len:224 (-) Transcript_39344:466-1137(-)